MNNYAVVSTKDELKKALERKVENIVVTDSTLATNIKVVKYSSRIAVIAATAGAGVALTNFWNPIGITSGIAAATIGGSTLTAIAVLGVGAVLAYAIYNEYDIDVKGKVKTPDGHEFEGGLVLKKK